MRSLPFTHTVKRVLSFGPPAIAATLVLLAAMSGPTPSYAQSVNASDAAMTSKARPTAPASKVAPQATSSAFTYEALGATPKVQPAHVRRAGPKEVKAAEPAQSAKTSERTATKTLPQPTP